MAEGDLSEQQILDNVADILLALANVGIGDYSTRLNVDANDTGPLASLCHAINEMIAALAAERAKTEAYQAELEEKLATIEQQRMAIKELSTPIMEDWDDVLCLPVVGILDTVRSTEMTATLLKAVSDRGTKCAILDITGIEVMDTRTVDHFISMAKAIRLLGAECALTGTNPHIAQTVVQMGIDLANVVTYRSLRDALWSYVSHGTVERGRSPTRVARGNEAAS
jgi:rsbT co-antagonist protein RsbR